MLEIFKKSFVHVLWANIVFGNPLTYLSFWLIFHFPNLSMVRCALRLRCSDFDSTSSCFSSFVLVVPKPVWKGGFVQFDLSFAFLLNSYD